MVLYRRIFAAAFVYLFSLRANAASEAQGGMVVGQFRPNYASDLKGTPELPTAALLKGIYATFIKKNVLIGGQVIYASAANTDNTQGTQYSFINASVLFGGSFRLGHFLDFDAALGIGLGQMNYANASPTVPLALQAAYLSAQPQLSFGLLLTQSFKISLGGGYQLGYVYDVTQTGPSANFIDKATEKVKVGGVAVMIQFALIQ